MCVAIAVPAGLSLDKETLELCYKQNPDGCGMSYINSEGNIEIFKHMEFGPFLAEYQRVQALYNDSPFLIHFRIRTHGTTDLFNCHPFRINDDMTFIHNGVINKVKDCPDKLKSDTQMFNELILQKLPVGWEESEGILEIIEEYIGYSKLAVLHRNGNIYLFNEEKGTWKDGVWFSNTHWERKTYYDWRDSKSHADHCLQCNNWIRNNVYANKNGWSFCSEKCRTTYQEKWKKVAPCDMCDSNWSFISVYRDEGVFNFCSKQCEQQHNELMTHVKQKKQDQTLQLPFKAAGQDRVIVYCSWCDEVKPEDEMLEVEDAMCSYNKDVVCVDCVKEYTAAGVIMHTPEIDEAIKLIEDRRAKQAA